MPRLKTVIRFLAKWALLVGGYFSDWGIGYGLYGFVLYTLYRYLHLDTAHSMLIAMMLGIPVSAVWSVYFVHLYDRAGGFRFQNPKKEAQVTRARKAKGVWKWFWFVVASLKGGPSATLAAMRDGGENGRGLSYVDLRVRLPICVLIANTLWTLRAGGIAVGFPFLLHVLDAHTIFYQFFIFRML